ncbi:MAG TPA: TonB-dependent receptor [Sphingomicrobium sp.]|nr:TonB-dependent receptor [Sphingomicrobium sp.]
MTVYSRQLAQSATSTATALALVLATPAYAQAQNAPAADQPATSTQPATTVPETEQPQTQGTGAGADEFGDEGGEIVVTGVRRGSVVGDIPPENVLNSRDVRATGATSIDELLDALAPQIGSARGRGGERPVMLLNGQRVSSFREIRDIPTEAIERLEILPEEVALKYGYAADQRVVNIVLRERFRSTAARLDGNTSTEGGYLGGTADLTKLLIQKNGRTTFNVHAEGNSPLSEDERDIRLDDPNAPDDRSARTLVSEKEDLRGSATVNRTILTNVGATLNAELEHIEGRSLFGLSDFALDPLVRNTSSDSAHVGFTLNTDKGKWHFSSTGNGDLDRSVSRSDQKDGSGRDRAETTSTSADVDLTANGPLFAVPAGDASATFRVGGRTSEFDSEDRTAGIVSESDLSRTVGLASANVDLPISRRNRDFSALGNLTLNANAELDQLSDFGTLITIGGGLNWSPVDRLNFIASWTREEGAPSMQQLGDPMVETPETRIFDFTTGQTVEVTAISGGNPDLLADRRNVFKIGGNWKPLGDTDLRLRAEYVHSRLENPISTFPGVTDEIEEAFPERFVRDASGQLVSVDFRPVNYDEARKDTIRWGFDFSKPLKSARPSQAALDRFRAQRAAQTGQAGASGQGTPRPDGGPSPEGAGPPPGGTGGGGPGAGGFGPGGGFGGGRFGGNRQGGRLQFSLTHTWNLVDEVTIRPGLPDLDYLHGDAAGSNGGTSHHLIEAQGGYYNNGLGARISADWRSGTHVDSSDGNDLDFSPLATFDLRLFANLGERFDLVSKHPWLRGTSLRFEVNNIFDTKPKVRDSAGGVPFNYQPDLLDPLGRTISVSFRKLFLPPPSFFRRQSQPSTS